MIFYRHRSSIIAHSFRRNNEFKLLLRIFMFTLLALFAILARLSSFIFRTRSCFTFGAAPPLSLDHSAGRKQPLAVEFSPFLSFFPSLSSLQSHTSNLNSDFFKLVANFLLIPPGLLLANKWPPMFLTGPPFYCRRRTRFNLCILLLLIIGGVEVNPGPSSSVNLTISVHWIPGRWSIRHH